MMWKITFIFLFEMLLWLLLFPESKCILLKDFGVIPLSLDAISLVFYATVVNTEDAPFAVGLKMDRCCQFIKGGGELDCESMRLHSDLDLEMFTKDVRNLTMYYLNLYLQGRNGSCSIWLRWRPLDSNKREPFMRKQFDVHFDTLLPKPNFVLQYWQNDPDTHSLCSSIDEDPKNNCQPVNCLLKYSGFRSFYNQTKKLCQNTPVCTDLKTFSQLDEKRPSVVLSPISNTCVNLWSPTSFTENMPLTMTTSPDPDIKNYNAYPISSLCVHGRINSDKVCVCDKGWTSEEFPSQTFNPTYDMYSMCNMLSTRGEQEEKAHTATISFYMLIILLCSMAILLCICIPKYLRRNRTSYDELYSRSGNPTKEVDSSAKVISEVKNRHEIVLQKRRATPFPTKTIVSPDQNQSHAGNPATNMGSNTNLSQNRTNHATMSASRDSIPSKSPSTTSGLNTFLPSNQVKSNLTSKKLLFPQVAKSTIKVLPTPLSPTIIEAPKPTNQIVKRHEMQQFENSASRNQAIKVPIFHATLKKDSPSVMKLKTLLKEVEYSTKQLNVEIKNVTDNVSDGSLDRFSALHMNCTARSSTEFWENVSDSDEGLEGPGEIPTQNNSYGFWVHSHLLSSQQ